MRIATHMSVLSHTHTDRCWPESTHMNEAFNTYEEVTSHKWMSHVAHTKKQVVLTNGSRHSHTDRSLPHVNLSYKMRFTSVNESSRTYERVVSHIRTSNVVYMNESRRTNEGVTRHI